jgi:hypothetical protein
MDDLFFGYRIAISKVNNRIRYSGIRRNNKSAEPISEEGDDQQFLKQLIREKLEESRRNLLIDRRIPTEYYPDLYKLCDVEEEYIMELKAACERYKEAWGNVYLCFGKTGTMARPNVLLQSARSIDKSEHTAPLRGDNFQEDSRANEDRYYEKNLMPKTPMAFNEVEEIIW